MPALTTETMTEFVNGLGDRPEGVVEDGAADRIHGYEQLEDFVNSLASPRRIMIMVKAGKPVDAVIEGLKPLLDKGDIIIDGGNADYTDTNRRHVELAQEGFRFIGTGVSGGEEGALKGPSIMEGYANNPEATAQALTEDGWLNTGDVGYRAGDALFITGRSKDVLIINGRNIWPQDLEYIAEQQPEVRPEDASAFSIPADDGTEVAVLVVQCRQTDAFVQANLVERLKHRIQSEFGIACLIELVPLHTLPRTSSGKLSRSGAKVDFLQRNALDERGVLPVTMLEKTAALPAKEGV